MGDLAPDPDSTDDTDSDTRRVAAAGSKRSGGAS
jgi:hypothetical protein